MRGWIIDVDGCLVRTNQGGGTGGEVMARAGDFLTELRRRGEPYVVCTNASDQPPAHYSAYLRSIGLDVPEEDFATAGSAAADYLAATYPGRPVVVVGSEGFVGTMRERGVVVADPDRWHEAAAAVVGAAGTYDIADVNAAALAAESGVPLYSSVVAPWFHGGITKSVASSAVIAAGIAWAAGTTPTVLGKPSPHLGRTLATQLGMSPEDVVVVGDSLVEVELAHHMGGTSFLLMSGATTEDDLHGLPPYREPTRVFPEIADVFQHLTTSSAHHQEQP